MSVEQWAEQAVDFGLDAIDPSILFLADLSIEEIAALRGEIEKHSIKVAAMTAYPNFTHPDSDQRERQSTQFCEHMQKCAAVGAEIVVGFKNFVQARNGRFIVCKEQVLRQTWNH